MRITCGGKWTIDGRWVVVGQMFDDGPTVILFDPSNNDPWLDLADCWDFVKTFEIII